MTMPQLRWWHGWLPLLLLPGAVFLLVPSAWPRWAFMWVLAFAIFAGCKWLTWRRARVVGVPLWKHVGYLVAWPGMDAGAFLGRGASATPQAAEWMFAVVKLVMGIAWLVGLSRLGEYPLLAGWLGMIGIVMVLHFGLFHLLSCFWRNLGVDAQPLMDSPLLARSVSEFWGKRWNLAFRDLTHRFLFRPLSRRLGPRGALAVGFIWSGLIHDVVISVPAGGGYGGPTLFFLIQGLAIFVERGEIGRRLHLGAGFTGWLFTMIVLAGPVGLLFPRPFVEGIIVPFLKATGAL